jgi:toxin secretion/phage lysis holin
MKTIWVWAQTACAAIGGGIGYFLGGFDGFLYALVAFVVIDYITGLIRGALEKTLSSEVGFRGIIKKVLIFTMVAVGNLVDKSIIGNGEVIRTAVIFFYLSNEGISIIENAAACGLPVPEKLREILAQLRDKGGKSGKGGGSE